ncbi:MAG: homoserine kinase, partial [Acidimicrobiales bacterium]
MTAVRARVPASSANLGPGFDTLAIALGLYCEVEIEPAPALSVRSEGEGDDLPADASHLAARIAVAVAGHDRLAIFVRSDIPVGRG